MKIKLFLLEKDIGLNESIRDFLDMNGYDVLACTDGAKALNIINNNRFDLLILDAYDPQIDRATLLKGIRKSGNRTPVIFTVALCEEDEAELEGYLKKPFLLNELLVRVEGLVRRKLLGQEGKRESIAKEYSFDVKTQMLFCKNEKVVLHKDEENILALLLENRGRVVTFEMIKERLYQNSVDEETIKLYIKNLRTLLGSELIGSFRKIGYKLIES